MVPHKSGYDAGEHAAGVTGSIAAVGDVHLGAANCSTDSKEEVHVIGSPGIAPQSGDSKGDCLEECKLCEACQARLTKSASLNMALIL